MRQLGTELVCSACLAEASAPTLERMVDMAQRGEARLKQSRLAAAGIPASFSRSTFESWSSPTERASRVGQVLGRYCSDFARQRVARTGFIFTGPPGTGKTHLACAMVSALIENGFAARYLSLPAFTRAIKASYSKAGQTDALLRGAIECDFLVLDEIDLHGTTDTDYTVLYDVINGRYERGGCPTLAISNRSRDHLIVDLDARIVSRILGGSEPIVFDWPSRREVRLSQRRFTMEGVQ